MFAFRIPFSLEFGAVRALISETTGMNDAIRLFTENHPAAQPIDQFKYRCLREALSGWEIPTDRPLHIWASDTP
jgi:hypothetical protein